MRTVFDSTALPERERLAAFEAATARSLLCTRFRFSREVPFAGSLSAAPLGALGLSAAAYTTLGSHRTPRLIRQGDPELIELALITSGRQRIEQAGRVAALGRGDVVAYDSSRPFDARAVGDGGPARALFLHIPRRLLPLRSAELAQVTAVPMRGDRGVGRLLAGFLTGLVDEYEAYAPADPERLAGTALDLTTTVLLHQLGREPGGPRADRALYLRSLSVIRDRLADSRLTPDAVAAALGVSRRQLYRVHQRHGTSVAALIRERRLERCRRDLADPRLDHLTIGALAARWGFSGHAEFTRTFRTAHGMTPSAYRAAARHGPAAG